MTGAGIPSLPGGRVLARWWQQLAARAPRRLWFSRLLCHRIEALVEVSCPCPLAPLQQALLMYLCQSQAALEALRLERTLQLRFLHELAQKGLAQVGAAGWEPTPAGRQVAGGVSAPVPRRQRRPFYFVENTEFGQPPHFLHLAHGQPQPARLENASFDPSLLRQCVQQDDAWKQKHHFPKEITALVLEPGDWRSVVVDFPEQVTLVLVEVEGAALLGFAVSAKGELQTQAPAVDLRDSWDEVFPELLREPSLEEWRASWQSWCQPRNLPRNEVDACRLERIGSRLRVSAPQPLVERVSGSRGETLAREGWLLAGSGRSRQAAQIELVEGTGAPAG